ncbi:amino acid adenylation domain-containing protein [Streptomyces sp. NPDC057638]|uniref:non-ribosomal peptide synthetase n=1 Tax=Streptomyces sp. NPDC057638 TaxID=3346190 RepID=UPI0036896ECB
MASSSSNSTTVASRKEEALWLLERLVPGTGVNNLSLAFRVDSPLSTTLLSRSLTLLASRHAVLRTVFHAEETGLLKEVLSEGRFPVEVSRTSVTGSIDSALTAFVAQPFTLDGQPLLRAGYFTHELGDYFCLAVHHLVFDTTSAVILCDELIAVYTALAAEAEAESPMALRHRGPVADEAIASAESLAFWRSELSGAQPQDLELNCSKPDRGEPPNLDGDQVTVDLSAEAVATVRRLAKELRAPEAVVLLAAYSALLAGHGAGPDTVIGSPIDIRRQPSLGAIGYHVNVLPLRIPYQPEQGFTELVRRTRDIFFGALTHSDVPVDHLLSEIPRSNSSWRHTLFRHVFNYVPQNGPTELTIAGIRAEPVTVENGSSKFDLEFFLLPSDDGITLRVVYGTQTLARNDARALAARYDALLTTLGENPQRPLGDISQCAPGDRSVIDRANDTMVPEGPTVLEQILARAAHSPHRVAVEDGERQVSYGQLVLTARLTERLLRAHGVSPRDRVAVYARRGPELAAAVLGIWLTGAAYVPLDPDHPRQRVEYQLTDSGVPVVLAAPESPAPAAPGRVVVPLVPVVPDAPGTPDVPDTAPGAVPDPRAAAYLIYTSGSTGRPKGTVISHGALANLIAHFTVELDVTPDDAALWMTTFSFDISALELFLPLTSGGRLVIATDESRLDGTALAELLKRHDVGIVQATPTTWRIVADEASGALAGRRVLCGGEPMPVQLAHRLLETGCELRNVYGPTETTIWSTSTLVSAGQLRDEDTTVAVGAPLRNTRVFVASPEGPELPIGVSGELCIAGSGVAIGYHNLPRLTGERFGEHPAYGRFYRTGDLARWRADGTLEVLGRHDRQIKLRGNRIELGEVESVLLAHPDVAAVAVVVAGDTSADGVLVGFVEATPDTTPHDLRDRLWEYARTELVGSSVPHHFEVVPALPTTANDKVDYPALVRQAHEWLDRSRDAEGDDAPASVDSGDPLVREIGELFRDLLRVHRVDASTNFFTNGGHSLLGAQLAQRIGISTGVRLRLAEVFSHPSPADLAQLVRSRQEG